MIKLEHFTSEIMSGVAEQKSQIETEQDKRLKEDYDKKELEYLEAAYEIIQTGLKDIDREKNEVISKTLMKNKVALLNGRKNIIDEVFAQAKKRLEAHTKTEGYKEELIEKINTHMDSMGHGDYIIYINYKDKELYHFLQDLYPEHKVFIERKHIEMIGGCKLLNKTKNVFIDDSYAKRLEEERTDFLQYCEIQIDDKVGD